jgi:hypothetical protein
MKYLLVHRNRSGVRPAMRPKMMVDVSALMRTDDTAPPTVRRPELAAERARTMCSYPEVDGR